LEGPGNLGFGQIDKRLDRQSDESRSHFNRFYGFFTGLFLTTVAGFITILVAG